MESYDRLFPSQDTMPKGGFGNLIALPLQRGPRQSGNSAFVDDNLVAFPGDEQWIYLARMQKLTPTTVESISTDASRRGSVIGVRLPEVPDDGDAATPWLRLPSGRPRKISLSEPVPTEVKGILAQRLFVEKVGLPSALVNQLKRVAAFQNPVFYRRQSLRLSTALTPRVVTCAEELEKYFALPRACRSEVDSLLQTHGAALQLDDQRYLGDTLDVQFHGVLTDVQRKAAQALLAEDLGVLVAPPATGKTVVGTYLVAARGRTTLVLVNRQTLLDQWRAQLALFLGLEPGEIGQIGGGKHKPNRRLDVAMLQSLVRKDSVDDLVATYGQVIVDECHHLPARSFDRVLSETKARFVVGLTATPHRKDGHHPIMEMQLGPVRFRVDSKSGSANRPFAHRLLVRETTFPAPSGDQELSIQALYAALAADESRNQMILDDLLHAVDEGRSPLLLTERREHLELLASRLQKLVRHLVVLHGGMGAKRRREIFDRLASIPRGEERVLLATGRYIGEGFDDSRLDTLFLALPVSWKGTLVQYTGRLHRLSPGKTEVRLYDYVDQQVPMLLKMFERRLRAYRAIGYARGEAPLGFAERPEPRIEYDEEVLRELRRNEEPW